MKILKNNKKFIIGIIIGISISCGSVYAIEYLAKDIKYTNNKNENVTSVKDALDDLYSKQRISSETDKVEYLNDYVSSSYGCSACNGTVAAPNLSIDENIATVNLTNVSNSQGTTYVYIEDISKYKYITVNLNGSAKSFNVNLIDGLIQNNYNLNENSLFCHLWQSSPASFENTTTYIDTSKLSGDYTLVFVGTYFNLKIETKGYLK